jgi:hypothetical protein
VDEDLGWIGRVHRRTDTALGYGLRPQEAAVVRGMVLGDRSLIPEDLEEAFQRSGITHSYPTSGKACSRNFRCTEFASDFGSGIMLLWWKGM